MKKVLTHILISACLLPTVVGSTACSDQDENEIEVPEEKPEVKPEGGSFEIPPEVIDKVHEVYAGATLGPQKVTSVNQLAILTSICALHQGEGPITVTAATLNGEDITLLMLGGTQEVEGQATTMEENQLASFGKPNDYLTAVVKLFTDGTIPSQKPVLVTGISLGGMIAQQLLGQSEVVDHFTLRAVITYGSPITLPLDRKGCTVVRFADEHDMVPKLGETILRSGLLTGTQMSRKELMQKLEELDAQERIVRAGKYTEMIETHALSYIEDECWGDVDFLGDPAKKNKLELKETMKFYQAPKLTEKK